MSFIIDINLLYVGEYDFYCTVRPYYKKLE